MTIWRRNWPGPEFTPRALFERFKSTCSAPPTPRPTRWTSTGGCTRTGWRYIRPTFRPDAVVNLASPGWREQIAALSEVAGIDMVDYADYIQALEQRRGGLQSAGRAGHRSWRVDPLYRAPERRGGRAPSSSAPCAARPRGGRGALHRAHADGVGAHERRGWAGDAVARGQPAQPQRRAVPRASGRITAPISRSRRSGRATCSRCSTPSATTRASA